MSDREQTPLDLRSLSAVESPDVVKDALRRFRLRALVALGLAAVLIIAAAMVIAARRPASIEERVSAGEQANLNPIVIRDDRVHAVLLEVTRLDEASYAARLLLIVEELEEGKVVQIARLERSGAASADAGCAEIDLGAAGAALEATIAVPIGTERISLDVAAVDSLAIKGGGGGAVSVVGGAAPRSDSCEIDLSQGRKRQSQVVGRVELDMVELGLPSSLWREAR